MNEFEKGLKRYLAKDALSKIRKANIGIAGAGGLGSNCALNLVRCGFRKFTIVDFDWVDFSNLNRQFFFNHQVGNPKVSMLKENLLGINPDLDIRIFSDTLNPDNLDTYFSDCDVIVEAFDRPACKKMIVEKYMTSEKLLVAASGLGGFGNSDAIRTTKIRDTFYIIGDRVSEVTEELPPLSPGVNIAAAKQADVILTYITGEWDVEERS